MKLDYANFVEVLASAISNGPDVLKELVFAISIAVVDVGLEEVGHASFPQFLQHLLVGLFRMCWLFFAIGNPYGAVVLMLVVECSGPDSNVAHTTAKVANIKRISAQCIRVAEWHLLPRDFNSNFVIGRGSKPANKFIRINDLRSAVSLSL